ncbi:unnamed protein product, partial [Didymodactylos carnosus]
VVDDTTHMYSIGLSIESDIMLHENAQFNQNISDLNHSEFSTDVISGTEEEEEADQSEYQSTTRKVNPAVTTTRKVNTAVTTTGTQGTGGWGGLRRYESEEYK